MANMTNEQIEAKKQQLKQLAAEIEQLTKELVNAGAIELSEENLDEVAGGNTQLMHNHTVLDKPKKLV